MKMIHVATTLNSQSAAFRNVIVVGQITKSYIIFLFIYKGFICKVLNDFVDEDGCKYLELLFLSNLGNVMII